MSDIRVEDATTGKGLAWREHIGLLIAGFVALYGAWTVLAVSRWDTNTALTMLKYSNPVDIILGSVIAGRERLGYFAACFLIFLPFKNRLMLLIPGGLIVLAITVSSSVSSGLRAGVPVAVFGIWILVFRIFSHKLGAAPASRAERAFASGGIALTFMMVAVLSVVVLPSSAQWLPLERLFLKGEEFVDVYVLEDEDDALVTISSGSGEVARYESSDVKRRVTCRAGTASPDRWRLRWVEESLVCD